MKRFGKRMLKAAAAVCAGTACAAAVKIFLQGRVWKASEAGSVGIIGGADGPTVIFTAYQPTPLAWVLALLLLAAAGAALLLVFKKRR